MSQITKEKRDVLREDCDPRGFPLHNAKQIILELLTALDEMEAECIETERRLGEAEIECVRLHRETERMKVLELQCDFYKTSIKALENAQWGNCWVCAQVPSGDPKDIIGCSLRVEGKPRCPNWAFDYDRFEEGNRC